MIDRELNDILYWKINRCFKSCCLMLCLHSLTIIRRPIIRGEQKPTDNDIQALVDLEASEAAVVKAVGKLFYKTNYFNCGLKDSYDKHVEIFGKGNLKYHF